MNRENKKSMQTAIDALIQLRDERDWKQFHSPENLAKSICIEAGELLECFQWSGEQYDVQDVKEELADVLSYCLDLCIVLDLDPETIVLEKLAKTKQKYPAEKAKGRATKYDKL